MFLSCCLQDVFFGYSFQKLNYDVSWPRFLCLYPSWGSFSFRICRFMSLAKFGEFPQPLFLKYFSSPSLFLLSFQDVMTWMIDFCVFVPQVPKTHFLLNLFSLCCTNWVYYSVFQFTDSLFPLFCYWALPMCFLFRLWYFFFFSSKFLFDSSLGHLFFFTFIIAHWNNLLFKNPCQAILNSLSSWYWHLLIVVFH